MNWNTWAALDAAQQRTARGVQCARINPVPLYCTNNVHTYVHTVQINGIICFENYNVRMYVCTYTQCSDPIMPYSSTVIRILNVCRCRLHNYNNIILYRGLCRVM